MKRIVIIMSIVCAIFGSFSVTGCYYDAEEDLYGSGCDTSNVTYSATIRSIITNNACLNCHGGVAPVGGFNLETHAEVKAKVTDGRLLGAISHANGFIAMPEGLPKMSRCDIEKVKVWIDAGTPNN